MQAGWLFYAYVSRKFETFLANQFGHDNSHCTWNERIFMNEMKSCYNLNISLVCLRSSNHLCRMSGSYFYKWAFSPFEKLSISYRAERIFYVHNILQQ